jgi:transposase-like protein
MPPRLSDEHRAAILTDIQHGTKSARQIARDHNVAVSTVSKIAADEHVDGAFERSQTKKAVAASTVDFAARRAALAGLHLTLAEKAAQRAIDTIDEATPSQAAIIAGIAVDKHRALDQYDADTQGLAAVDAWLKATIGD